VKLLLQTLAIIACGVLGSILFKLGVMHSGDFNPFSPLNWLNFILTPIVFLSLTLLFISRILWNLPLRDVGVGFYTAIIIPLNISCLLIASYLLLGEQLTLKELLGIALICLGVIIVGWGKWS